MYIYVYIIYINNYTHEYLVQAISHQNIRCRHVALDAAEHECRSDIELIS